MSLRPVGLFLVIFFIILAQSSFSQWNPDAGLVTSLSTGATVVASSNNTSAPKVIDGNEQSAWQSGGTFPSLYIERSDLNILLGSSANGICNLSSAGNCTAVTDGNLSTSGTFVVSGNKAWVGFALVQPSPMRNISMKSYGTDTVFLWIFRGNQDSIRVGFSAPATNYTFLRFPYVTTGLTRIKAVSKQKFSLFEVAALSGYPTEYVTIDLGSVKNIGSIKTRHWSGSASYAISTELFISSDNLNWQLVANLNPDALNAVTTDIIPPMNGRFVKVQHTIVEADYAKVSIWETEVFDGSGTYGPMPEAMRGKITLSEMLGVNGIWGWGYNMFSNSLASGQGPTKFNKVATHARNYHNLHWDVSDPDLIPNYNNMPGGLAITWIDWDREYRAWKNAGLKVGATIQFNNNTMPQSTWNNPYQAGYNYAYAFARHFGPTYGNGLVDYFEAGNEPWDYPASFYNEIQAGMIRGAKAGDSALFVLPCALQSDNPLKETATGGNYMGARITQQDAPYIDGINVHHYSYTNNQDGVRIAVHPESKESELRGIMNDIRFRDANLPGKKIYVTEWGWDSDGAGESCTFGECVSENEQALYAVRGAMMFLRLGVDRVNWYFYGNQTSGHLYSRCGLESTAPGHQNKKSYYAFQSLISKLGNKFFLGTIQEDDNAWVYLFGEPNGKATHLVAWRPVKGDDNAQVWITLPHYIPDSAWTITGATATGEYAPSNVMHDAVSMSCRISSAPLVVEITNVDCNGVINGTAVLDLCGVCNGDNSTCKDCAGVVNGTAFIDDCGKCAGGATRFVPNIDKDCNGVCFGTAIRDCNGDCNGSAFLDDCSICSGGNSGHVPNSDTDCNGVCMGDARVDCNGDCSGKAYLDDCGICSGGNTGRNPNLDKDCNGDCFGSAYLNGCGICSGGNVVCDCVGGITDLAVVYHGQNGATVNVYKKKITQSGNLITSFTNVLDGDTLSINATNLTNGKFEATTYFHIAGSSSNSKVGINTSCSQSIEGQTFGAYTVLGFTDLNGNVCGTSSDCVDCNGVMNGGAVLDVCGVCGGDNSTCLDCNGVPNGGALIDDCGICSGGTTGRIPNSSKDCSGVCFGTAVLDQCGVCNGNNNTCLDCNGVPNGGAIIDDCGICSGGSTGHQPNSDKDCNGVCFGTALPESCKVISGQLKKWHKITFLFDGVATSENAVPNPFLDYRLIVTFSNGNKIHAVYGHYAADGNSAETGASAGNKWRAYFSPDDTGTWTYSVSFRTGTNIGVDDNPSAGLPVAPLDGNTGSFLVSPSDKTGNDFRRKGKLSYTGGHYLQFAETGEYFLKGGADSPENFLAFWEFDGTYDASTPISPIELINGLHRYTPHTTHWHPGDPQWKSGKGKGIVGALNYLASKGINSMYFLTYNIDGGDGKDVWMWTSNTERWRYDVSKLDQWEKVFAHMDSLGIQMHVVTQEIENQNSLSGASVTGNNMRKLYYRELISRYSHHLGVLWNMGEENSTDNSTKAANAQYIREKDSYDHPIAVHTLNNGGLPYYQPLLDNSTWIQYFEVTSLQGDGLQYNPWAHDIRNYSASKGKKWVVCGDEQTPDVSANMSNLYTLRKDALWGNLMGGGSGVEWYFGYQGTFGDLTSEDWSVAGPLWDQTKIALDFFQIHLPFTQMTPDNSVLTATGGGYGFYKNALVYAIYLSTGGSNSTVSVNLPSGSYNIRWFNPRTGGSLLTGSMASVTSSGGFVSIGKNPASDSQDWVVLITSSNSSPPPPATVTVSITQNGLSAFCQGDQLNLLAESPTAIRFQWSTGEVTASILVSSPGNYSVTAYDAASNSAVSSITYNKTNLLSTYAILATGQVKLNGTNIFSGGVGVTGSGNSAIISNSTITAISTFAKADNINATGSSIASQYPDPSTVVLPTFMSSMSNGGSPSVTVAANMTMTLTGTAYRDIVVENNATLIFTAPAVHLWTLATGTNVTIKSTSCSNLRLKNTLTLGANNTFNPDNAEMVVFVAKTVSIGGGVAFNADLYSKSTITILDGTAADPNVIRGLFMATIIDAKSFTEWHRNESCLCTGLASKLSAVAGDENVFEQDIDLENNMMISAFPNPFDDKLNFEFSLSEDSEVRLEIYNITGQLQAVAFEGQVAATSLQKAEYIPASGTNGIIIYRLQTEHGTWHGKAVTIK